TYDPVASEAVITSPGFAANNLPTSAGGTAVSFSGCRVHDGDVVAFSPFAPATVARRVSGVTDAASSLASLSTISRRRSACQAATALSFTSSSGLTCDG